MIPFEQQNHDEFEQHRRRLAEQYKPQTSRERMIIDELARVYQEKEAFQRDQKLWMQHEANTALQTIQRQEADDFLKLRRQWTKAPAAVAPLIGQSLNGALWLVEFWQMLLARLNPKSIGPAPGMDQACQTLLVMGFAEKIQSLSEPGWWWATRFLAIQADKDEAVKAWLRKSGTCDRTTETQQARCKLYDAPDASMARQELYDEATRQLATWQDKLRQLKEAEPAQRQAQLAQARCMGLKTPGLATCLNNAFRLRDAVHRGIKFLEDRLARAQQEIGAKTRENHRKTIHRSMPQNTDLPRDPLEEAIRTDLLPRMAAALALPPANRPMSNRKKQLARMAAREEKARLAAAPLMSMA